jgi:uncharacterized protein (DUF2147 family)
LPLRPAALILAAVIAPAAAAPAPVGRWLTEDRGGVIEIFPCAAALCGRIVGMTEPLRPDGKPQTDSAGQPKCGLTILHDAIETEPGQWSGRITDPDDGSDWHCVLSVDAQGRLHLRGYVLLPLLGQTQIWTPYSGRLGADCRMAS